MKKPEGFFGILLRVITILNYIGAVALTFMMGLTVCDVLLRAFGHPIMGTFEIVSLSLAIVIGFGIPKVSADRGHVYMEFVTEKLSKRSKAVLNTFTRVICILLFILIAYNLIGVGNEFRLSGEVTSTIRLPFFPLAYCVGVCCFLQVFVFLYDIIKIWRGDYE
jgi:TRAP-type C4-dicarboxylate transport system permease small subunit